LLSSPDVGEGPEDPRPTGVHPETVPMMRTVITIRILFSINTLESVT